MSFYILDEVSGLVVESATYSSYVPNSQPLGLCDGVVDGTKQALAFANSILRTFLAHLKPRTHPKIWIYTGAAVLGYVVFRRMNNRHFISRVLDATKIYPKVSVRRARSAFVDLQSIKQKAVPGHTHGKAAANRSSATLTAVSYARSIALEPYFVQMSASDQKHGYAGSRSYFWAKDAQISVRNDQKHEGHVPVLVDVDYYMDMPKELADGFSPTLVYTFQPSAVAHVDENYSYTFNKDNEVLYRVTGGGDYKHQVWNYSQDSVLVKDYFCGILSTVKVYYIERKKFDLNHELILLAPAAKWRGIFAWLANHMFGATELQRLKVVDDGFTRLNLVRKGKVMTATGKVDCYSSAVIESQRDEAIAATARVSKLDLTLPQVLTLLPEEDKVEARVQGLLLLEYHKKKVSFKPDIVYPLDQSVQTYQFYPKRLAAPLVPTLKPFMSPVIAQCYAPALSIENEEALIKGRILDVRAKELEITPMLHKFMDEFIDLFWAGKRNTLDPVEIGEVYERQNRPTQRRIIEDSFYRESKETVTMFMKKEAYSEPKDPRPISIIDGPDKVRYSQFIYALTNHIETEGYSWYAFGKTPREIAECVCSILAQAKNAVNTDLSRMDGHISCVLREFEKRLMIAGFKKTHHSSLSAAQQSQINRRAYGMFGTKYDTEYARSSGSPETAVFNTIDTSFIDYISKRMTVVDGAYMTPGEAYAALGIYGGDDGVSVDVNPEALVHAGEMVGQVVTTELIERGQFGVSFLSRMYSADVWNGNTSSCCDILRAVSKFHATVSLGDMTPVDKLLDKSFAAWLTDKNTPIIGPLVSKVVALAPKYQFTNILESYWACYDIKEQFPNDNDGWMEGYVQAAIPGFDHVRLLKFLNECKSITDVLKVPLCVEPTVPEVKQSVIVGDDVLEPPEKKEVEKVPVAASPDACQKCTSTKHKTEQCIKCHKCQKQGHKASKCKN